MFRIKYFYENILKLNLTQLLKTECIFRGKSKITEIYFKANKMNGKFYIQNNVLKMKIFKIKFFYQNICVHILISTVTFAGNPNFGQLVSTIRIFSFEEKRNFLIQVSNCGNLHNRSACETNHTGKNVNIFIPHIDFRSYSAFIVSFLARGRNI